jgi:hypothetical protein
LTGVLASLVAPLAAAGLNRFVVFHIGYGLYPHL